MLRFAKELKQPAVLYGLHEGFRATELLKAAGMPVIVSTKWPTRVADADPDAVETTRALETRAKAASTPGLLAKNGVKFAFSSDGQTPAEIFGVADRIGSIEKGKIANLVLTRGDLLSERPRIEYMIVDGVKYLPPVPPAVPA